MGDSMKKYQQKIIAGIAMTVLVFLIIDTKTACTGAQIGIQLCITTLVPALFPFLVISTVCSQILLCLKLKLPNLLLKPCKFISGTEAIYLVGLVAGYPIGAKLINDTYKRGIISKSEANRMLMFCNNAGPAFIFGIIGNCFFQKWIPCIMWIIHILSSFIVGTITARPHIKTETPLHTSNITLTAAVVQAVKSMGYICGWVILFRTLIAFLDKWILWALPIPLRILITGCLELSNGCLQISQIENEGLRFMISLLILSFGGLCVTMQTTSITPGLSLKHYIIGKVYQSAFSLLIAYPFQAIYFNTPYLVQNQFLIPFIFFCLSLVFSKKIVAFRNQLIYNKRK